MISFLYFTNFLVSFLYLLIYDIEGKAFYSETPNTFYLIFNCFLFIFPFRILLIFLVFFYLLIHDIEGEAFYSEKTQHFFALILIGT